MLNNARPNPQNNLPWVLDPAAPSCAERERACTARIYTGRRSSPDTTGPPNSTGEALDFGFIKRCHDQLWNAAAPQTFWLMIDPRCWQTVAFDSAPVICDVAEALNGLTGLECIAVRKQGAWGLHLAFWMLMTPPHQCNACVGMPISQSRWQKYK